MKNAVIYAFWDLFGILPFLSYLELRGDNAEMKILQAQNDMMCAENSHYCTLYRENLSFLLLRSLRYVLWACSTANIGVFDVSCKEGQKQSK